MLNGREPPEREGVLLEKGLEDKRKKDEGQKTTLVRENSSFIIKTNIVCELFTFKNRLCYLTYHPIR